MKDPKAPPNRKRISVFSGTRLLATLKNCLAHLHREVRIFLTLQYAPEKWVFVVGCYNSGTALLMNLLGSHPSISSLPVEGQFLTEEFPADYVLGLPRMWVLREDLFRLTEKDQGPDPDRIKREWAMRLDRSKPVFLEKSPPNAARTRWLQEHFEDAHFICIVRDGYAVAEGICRKAEPKHLAEGWPLHLCARQWKRSNEILLEDSEYLRHAIWVRYEDLAEQPEAEIRRILEFLGLWKGEIGIDLSRSWEIHERRDPIRNMNEESIGRLGEEDLRIVTEEAEDLLRHFGYPVRWEREQGG